MPCDSTILASLESNQLCNVNFFQQFISKQFAARFSCSGNIFFSRCTQLVLQCFSNYYLVSDFKSKFITINFCLLSNKPKSGYVSCYELTNSSAFFNLLAAVSLFRSLYVVRLRTFVNGDR